MDCLLSYQLFVNKEYHCIITNCLLTNKYITLHYSNRPYSPGCLSIGTNQDAISASRKLSLMCSTHILLMTLASALRRPLPVSPYTLDDSIFLQPSASIPDGPEPPFVIRVALSTMSSSMESKMMFEP